MKTNHFLKKAFYHNNHAFMLIAMFFLVIAYGMDVAFAWLMQELFDSVGEMELFR